ncbi:unnamed protein product [Clonostachys rosea f. rosea IK726]|uniref:Kanamycin B dioxygenase n=3 Tax=Bionectria ochroleuca TaxID=29856 RepID=A0A0B7JTN4_BIOOC|nr:unnamed protein product [Clonostachys rosea f. rosea IK726]
MAVTSPSYGPQAISMSEDERREGKYSFQTLSKALGALHQDGLVVLKGVIPVEMIDKLNAKMCQDADERISDPSQGYNHGVKSNMLQRPPITDPQYLSQEVFFNKFLLQLANAYLGHRPVFNWLTANTALANTGGQRQPVHKDGSFDHPLFPFYFIANIPLCDFSAENGSTEFWLGSHAHTTYKDQVLAKTPDDIAPYPTAYIGSRVPPVLEEKKAERMKIRPPIQPMVNRGDIMIRDIRLWHAGMPNNSDAHRIMLGLGYQSSVHPNYTLTTHLPFSQREFFMKYGGENVELRAQWYSDEDLAKTTADTVFHARPVYDKMEKELA